MNNKTISILLLTIMLLSPFAFASSVRLVKVSDLEVGDVILDEDGNEFEVGGVGNYNDGIVRITGKELTTENLGLRTIPGRIVGGLGRITGIKL